MRPPQNSSQIYAYAPSASDSLICGLFLPPYTYMTNNSIWASDSVAASRINSIQDSAMRSCLLNYTYRVSMKINPYDLCWYFSSACNF